MTGSDLDKIQKEINERKNVIRPALIESLKEARSHGDLSENFEYYAAKREKNMNESRIRYLERMIRTAHVIDDAAGADDEVALNKVVEVYFPEDDETESYRIVTGIRGNSLKNMVSIDSPIGRALMGHRVGETVRVETEAGSYEVRIDGVSAQIDDADDAIRGY